MSLATQTLRHGAALAAAAALLLSSGRASALSCATNRVDLPRNGDTGVPTNTLLWGYGLQARLRGPVGEVPMDARYLAVALWDGTLAHSVLVPRQPLEPETRYTIDDISTATVTFTTGPVATSTPPELPVLLSSGPFAGDGRGVRLELEYAGILIGDIGGLPSFTAVDDLFFEDPMLAGAVASPGIQWLTQWSPTDVGEGGCMVWPEGAGDRVDARFGVLDLAGDFSGWTDVALQLPTRDEAEAAVEARRVAAEAAIYGPREGRPSACTLTPSPSPGIGAGLALALVAMGAAGRRLRRR